MCRDERCLIYVRAFVSQHDPSQISPTEDLPDYVKDDQPFQEEEDAPNQNNQQFYDAWPESEGGKVDATEPIVSLKPGLVTIQCEDCGGSLPFPFNGFRRPAADSYNSNLMQNSFSIADISSNINFNITVSFAEAERFQLWSIHRKSIPISLIVPYQSVKYPLVNVINVLNVIYLLMLNNLICNPWLKSYYNIQATVWYNDILVIGW